VQPNLRREHKFEFFQSGLKGRVDVGQHVWCLCAQLAWCGDCLGTVIINGDCVQGPGDYMRKATPCQLEKQNLFGMLTAIECELFKIKYLTIVY